MINLALAQIVVNSTSLFFCSGGRKERKTKHVGWGWGFINRKRYKTNSFSNLAATPCWKRTDGHYTHSAIFEHIWKIYRRNVTVFIVQINFYDKFYTVIISVLCVTKRLFRFKMQSVHSTLYSCFPHWLTQSQEVQGTLCQVCLYCTLFFFFCSMYIMYLSKCFGLRSINSDVTKNNWVFPYLITAI